MYNIYLLEDNLEYSKYIEKLIVDYRIGHPDFSINKTSLIHAHFSDFTKTVHTNTSMHHNIYIIDIELDASINGLELAKAIRQIDIDDYIIFLTSHVEMTLASYQYNLKAIN